MKLFEFFSVPSVEKNEEDTLGKSDSQAEKEKLANDVFWHILDHDDLHKKHFFKIARDIETDLKKSKKVDRSKYRECWMPMVKEGCLDFHKQHKMKGHPGKVFDEDMCKGLCERLSDKFIEEIRKGDYKLGA